MDCWSTPSSLRSSLPWPCKLCSTFPDQFFTIIQTPPLSHSESHKKAAMFCVSFQMQAQLVTQFFVADLAAFCVYTLGTQYYWLSDDMFDEAMRRHHFRFINKSYSCTWICLHIVAHYLHNWKTKQNRNNRHIIWNDCWTFCRLC